MKAECLSEDILQISGKIKDVKGIGETERYTHLNAGQFSSVAQSCPTLHDPKDHSMTGLPIHHQLPEVAQTHIHRVGAAIQPSHPLLSPSPPAFDLSQHQSLFQ